MAAEAGSGDGLGEDNADGTGGTDGKISVFLLVLLGDGDLYTSGYYVEAATARFVKLKAAFEEFSTTMKLPGGLGLPGEEKERV